MSELSAIEKIIFPLDLPTKDEALKYVCLLKNSVGVFKIGLELFVACGPSIVEAVKQEAPGVKIFLDMKFHDIPETVKRAMRSASALGVDFVTVHCDNPALMEAAGEAASSGVIVLGVTVLTSLSSEGLTGMGMRDDLTDPSALVLHRAELAKEAGLGGIVCSGLEVKAVKEKFGDDLVAVTPGIRFAVSNVSNDDQKRVATPGGAVRDGADYIVVGRPIRDADNPIEAARLVAEDIHRAS